jgi:hypothetical protein
MATLTSAYLRHCGIHFDKSFLYSTPVNTGRKSKSNIAQLIHRFSAITSTWQHTLKMTSNVDTNLQETEANFLYPSAPWLDKTRLVAHFPSHCSILIVRFNSVDADCARTSLTGHDSASSGGYLSIVIEHTFLPRLRICWMPDLRPRQSQARIALS